jgi:hypothetical protein
MHHTNISKMISNMVGLAAGLEISKALNYVVGPGKANWAAASYPSVTIPGPSFLDMALSSRRVTFR